MTPDEAIKYFRTPAKIMKVLNIKKQNWNYWKKKGHIPLMRQHMLQLVTNGELKADLNDTSYLRKIYNNCDEKFDEKEVKNE